MPSVVYVCRSLMVSNLMTEVKAPIRLNHHFSVKKKRTHWILDLDILERWCCECFALWETLHKVDESNANWKAFPI